MHSYSTIDLGTPYHDPTSPLYHQSLRSSRTVTASTMTHASQLSPDYFSHKPRSFLSVHTDFDEKLAAAPQTPSQDRDRARRARLVGYSQPASVPAPPRVPRSRTLLRLLFLVVILVLVSLGWRCEAVGCKGRGGGALVGEYIGSAGYVGGGSVVAGWGTPEGVDLSKIWDRPSWGGERQGGEKGRASSTLDAFEESEGGDGVRDEEGELVGEDGSEEIVEWDDDEREFGGEQGGEGETGGGQQVQEQGEKGEANGEQQGEIEYELYEAPVMATIDGPVDEATDGAVEDGAVAAVAQPDAESDAQPDAQQDDHQVVESATLAQKGSWLGTMDGLW